ncbi:MAG: hypothetical protein HY898_00750 [Deltaproteobacteria bacterium]|nr:hypothetical protein [Deltaproteobacteria bacterium]
MKALECFHLATADSGHYQLHINEFVDGFRGALPEARGELINDPLPSQEGRMEGLIAAVVSSLCRECDMPAPAWVGNTSSDEPFFVLPAKSFAMRVRLMIESPPAFRIRRVFVPENYLSRA